LIPGSQRRLKKEFKTTAEEENWDIYPIDVIGRKVGKERETLIS
jgi:hypothetical protein